MKFADLIVVIGRLQTGRLILHTPNGGDLPQANSPHVPPESRQSGSGF